MTELKRGQQIMYVPEHLKERFLKNKPLKMDNLSGLQPGFVTSTVDSDDPIFWVFCRFWIVENGEAINELRTKANSEITPIDNVFPVEIVDQEWVEAALKEYCK